MGIILIKKRWKNKVLRNSNSGMTSVMEPNSLKALLETKLSKSLVDTLYWWSITKKIHFKYRLELLILSWKNHQDPTVLGSFMALNNTLSTIKIPIQRNMRSKWEEQRGKFLKTEFMNGNKMMVINMSRSLQSEVNSTINLKL